MHVLHGLSLSLCVRGLEEGISCLPLASHSIFEGKGSLHEPGDQLFWLVWVATSWACLSSSAITGVTNAGCCP